MSENSTPQAWVEIAEEDYLAARALLRRKEPLISSVCFHSQQCAEKYLKALLLSYNQDFPKTHDLQKLNDLCFQGGILSPLDPDRLDSLSYFAVQTRYPGEILTIDDAKEAIKIAGAVRRFSRKFLGLM